MSSARIIVLIQMCPLNPEPFAVYSVYYVNVRYSLFIEVLLSVFCSFSPLLRVGDSYHDWLYLVTR